jgi:hypothetical protein
MKYWNKSRKTVMKHWHSVPVESDGLYTWLKDDIKVKLQRLPLDGKFYIKGGRSEWLWVNNTWQWVSNPLTVYFQNQAHAVIFKLKFS